MPTAEVTDEYVAVIDCLHAEVKRLHNVLGDDEKEIERIRAVAIDRERENERLRDLLQAAVNLFEDIAEDDQACRAWLGDCNVALNRTKDSFPTQSQRRMLDAAPGPRWPAEK